MFFPGSRRASRKNTSRHGDKQPECFPGAAFHGIGPLRLTADVDFLGAEMTRERMVLAPARAAQFDPSGLHLPDAPSQEDRTHLDPRERRIV